MKTGALQGKPLVGHTNGVIAIAVGLIDGRPVVVSGGHDKTMRRWDLATGRLIGTPITLADSVANIAIEMVAGRSIIVSRDIGNTVSCWDMVTGQLLGKPLTEQLRMAVGTLDGHLIGATKSVGANGILNYWDLGTSRLVFTVDLGGVDILALHIHSDSHVVIGTNRGLLVLRLYPKQIIPLLGNSSLSLDQSIGTA